MDASSYEAVVVLSFGGPERPEDVMPFLEHVVAGKPVPRERLEAVAQHYHQLGGRSPINDHCRALVDALRTELREHGPALPVYWGNLHWHPFLADTLRRMREDGIGRAAAFVTSAYSSHASCRKYIDAIERARLEVGERAPRVDKLRPFFNHPGFIEPMAERVRDALAELPGDARATAPLAFTAHSIPVAMAKASDYVAQLEEACGLVVERVGERPWQLVYQSRSGPPAQPWLEPDILEHLESLRAGGADHVVVVPVGFVSDHMEVRWDLDTEARARASEVGLTMVRAGTVGAHPRFVQMVRELVLEVEGGPRLALGRLGPSRAPCTRSCCPTR